MKEEDLLTDNTCNMGKEEQVIHLINRAGEKLVVAQSEFYQGKCGDEWVVDFQWYADNGYSTLDEFAKAVGVNE